MVPGYVMFGCYYPRSLSWIPVPGYVRLIHDLNLDTGGMFLGMLCLDMTIHVICFGTRVVPGNVFLNVTIQGSLSSLTLGDLFLGMSSLDVTIQGLCQNLDMVFKCFSLSCSHSKVHCLILKEIVFNYSNGSECYNVEGSGFKSCLNPRIFSRNQWCSGWNLDS
jgi:hypothetical protein